jgi:hypothetical protein
MGMIFNCIHERGMVVSLHEAMVSYCIAETFNSFYAADRRTDGRTSGFSNPEMSSYCLSSDLLVRHLPKWPIFIPSNARRFTAWAQSRGKESFGDPMGQP